MKVLKILGIILAVLVVGYLIACVIGPKQLVVERSVDINAPVADVFGNVSSMEAQHAWSPWVEKEPDGKYTYSGPRGEVGSVYGWEGNITGTGTQTITAVKDNERIDSRLAFTQPQQMEADAYVTVASNDDGSTKASWGFVADLPFIGRGGAMLAGAQKQMEDGLAPDFEKGLNNLKAMCEAKDTYMGYKVTAADAPARTYIGKRKVVKVPEMSAFYAEVFPAAMAALGEAGLEPQGMPCSLAYTWDEANQESDLFAGIPAPEGTEIEGFETVTLPAQKTGTIDYYGPYEEVGPAHHAMEAYMQAHGIQPSWPVMETYVTDPGQEPDQSKWLTKVTYLFGE